MRRDQRSPGGIPPWTWPAALECRASPSRESRLPRTERTVECANAQQERGKNPQFREKKLLTAQRPRTYTHPTRPIKLLGPPHAYPQPAPTGQAPVVYAARCLHVPPGSNSWLDMTWVSKKDVFVSSMPVMMRLELLITSLNRAWSFTSQRPTRAKSSPGVFFRENR